MMDAETSEVGGWLPMMISLLMIPSKDAIVCVGTHRWAHMKYLCYHLSLAIWTVWYDAHQMWYPLRCCHHGQCWLLKIIFIVMKMII
jgi:hypothetical protein